MKQISLIVIFSVITTITFAQTTPVSGTVTDDQGKPVAFAFIKDAEHNYATFSGADGSFTLNADPASRLLASSNNYTESVVKIDNQATLKIVMKAGGVPSKYLVGSDGSFVIKEAGAVDKSARPLTKFGTTQEELHGSPYFYNTWVHGFAITPKDSIQENDSYLFNYDKIHGSLLYTDNGSTMNTLDKAQIKEFKLFDNTGQQVTFENVPAIDNKHYLQVLASGSKYKIYKQLGTEFVKADFQTNGITSSGNNYDSYVDQSVYYIVKLPGGQPQKVSLKRKSIKGAFSADAAKVNAFLSAHDSDEIDDKFLMDLGEAMNN